jgi:hypothetical protein
MKQDQLTYLSLPPQVDSLNWLSDHIEGLSAAGTQITGLEGVPNSLRELDISFAKNLQSLEFVPKGLKTLDLRGASQVKSLAGLPPGLESLKISGLAIKRLVSLPPSLKELHLESTEIRDLSDLPPSLRALHLQGQSFEGLEGLPQNLRALTLHSTSVGPFAALPTSLQTLTLIGNSALNLSIESLPPLVVRLVIDNQAAPDLSSLRLRYLSWLSDRREEPKGPYPSFLSSLTLRATEMEKLEDLPISLRALGLLHCRLGLPLDLPPELEVLDLTGYRQAEFSLPLKKLTGLKKLKLAWSSVKILPKLPPSLEELDLSGTSIDDFTNIPQGLKALIFCGVPISKLEVLRDQFPLLERLDLCSSPQLTELGPLPDTLRYLNLSGTQISRLPQLPVLLRELDISNTKIRSLQDLQPSQGLESELKSLTLSEEQVASLHGLPGSVRILRFVAGWERIIRCQE